MEILVYLRGADGNFEMASVKERMSPHMMDFAVRRRGSFFHARKVSQVSFSWNKEWFAHASSLQMNRSPPAR